MKNRKPKDKKKVPLENIISGGIGGFRQATQPLEFRIAAPILPDDWQDALQRSTSGAAQANSETPPSKTDVEIVKRQRMERERDKLLIEMATNVWQLRTRMLEQDGSTPKDVFRRVYRYVEAQWDTLSQMGFEIKDHTGAKFDVGLSLKVSAYQRTAGVTHERVQETLKPSIYFHLQLVQMGEVIVETPLKAAVTPETEVAPTAPVAEVPVASAQAESAPLPEPAPVLPEAPSPAVLEEAPKAEADPVAGETTTSKNDPSAPTH